MPEYCTQQNVIDRLTANGLSYLIDNDQDGEASTSEKTTYLDPAIERAGLVIDVAIQALVKTSTARAAGNAYLKHICVDLAVGELARVGAQDPPVSVLVAENSAKKKLERIRDRTDIIPGLGYSLPRFPAYGNRPSNGMVINPR